MRASNDFSDGRDVRGRQSDRPQSRSLCWARHNHIRRRSMAERSMVAVRSTLEERNRPAGEHNNRSFCGGGGDDSHGGDGADEH